MKMVILLALAGALLAGCATADSSHKAMQNLGSSQPDKSGVR